VLKKLAAIFFLTTYLFSSTEAGELLKLPLVFRHFTEHKQENCRISLLQFLDMHYMHGSPKDKDFDRDMQLPFKSLAHYAASITSTFIPLLTEMSVQPDDGVLLDQPVPLQTFPSFASGFHALVWQPPRIC
jgi:hypothetical protein